MKIIRLLIVLGLLAGLTACAQPEEKGLADGEVVEIGGVVLSGGDTSPAGLMDAPRTFVYRVQLDDGSELDVQYTAYPPMPAGNDLPKISLEFNQGEVRVGDYLQARGTYNQQQNIVLVAQEGDYIKTLAEKP